ncbi:FAD-dependent oxidoreductase [bacterium]|nr:FAD-dependent oxidoreductase [bacterium]
MSRKHKPDNTAPCMSVCPQGQDIRKLTDLIGRAGRGEKPQAEAFEEAWRLVVERNPLPAVCSRVCPHECESACNRSEHDCGVAINSIERFVGDWALEQDLKHEKLTSEKQPEIVAVIGSGPAGISCAYQLARRGYDITIFEAFPKSGGMLRYGIPAFRLPRKVLDAEIQKVLDLGVELRTNVMVGRDITLDKLKKDYDTIFLGIGAQKSSKLGISGEDQKGIYTGIEFLRTVNSGDAVEVGKKAIIVGGGNTAIDASRVARRLGADVTILYRRTRAEMPAYEEEIVSAEEEGIELMFLAAPEEIQSINGTISALVCQRMQLGEPDDSGRRRPVPIPGDTFTLPVDTLIIAVSQDVEWAGLEHLRDTASISSDKLKGITDRDGILAGGDVEDIGIVAEALVEGRYAAEVIHAKFRGLEIPAKPDLEVIGSDKINLHVIEKKQRPEQPHKSAAERLAEPWEEATSAISAEQVMAEAGRCINCGETFIKHPKTHPIHIWRRVSQIGVGTLLFNSFWGVISTKMVYGGPLRNVCVPGLNCHSCPTALMGCPIGMLQHFSATHRIPWFLIGFLTIIGLVSGRFTCGWLCPWGMIQDVLYKIKRWWIKIPKFLIYLKYVVLPALVIIVPYYTYEHWFSKLCPCGALIAGIPWVLWNPVDPVLDMTVIDPADIGTLFDIKMVILFSFLLMFLFIKRPFCRTICPLGAIYAFFNRISLVSLEVKDSCTNCGQCRAVCPTDLNVREEINGEGCIKCLECTQCQHIHFKWNWPWMKLRKLNAESAVIKVPDLQPDPAMSRTGGCQGSCHLKPAVGPSQQ